MPIVLLTLLLVVRVTSVQTQEPHLPASSHQAMVMGVDQDRTAHHFHLYEDGGAIDIAVKDTGDIKNRDAIRSHLPHIAMMFGQGNFDAPMLVHDSKDVPGTTALATLRDKVTYTYAETPAGGRLNMVTSDKTALAALHEFLKYQIREHHTGDPTTARPRQ